MRIRVLAIALAATATLSAAAIKSAAARTVITQSRTLSNGFTTCRFIKQTAIGDFGGFAQRRVQICRSNFGSGGGFF